MPKLEPVNKELAGLDRLKKAVHLINRGIQDLTQVLEGYRSALEDIQDPKGRKRGRPKLTVGRSRDVKRRKGDWLDGPVKY